MKREDDVLASSKEEVELDDHLMNDTAARGRNIN